jgi:NAD(P)-dependent dehydrogenase (short-subunit alcohol dehydrogenase family)
MGDDGVDDDATAATAGTDGVVGDGRVAVVTGGASGIGLALSEALVAAGSSVVVADLDLDLARREAERLAAGGARTAAVRVDVADPASVDALAAETLEEFGRVDLVCNNAGVSTFNLLEDQTLDDWQWVFDVDLWGVVHGIRTFLPILRSQGGPGHIVNTSSMGGLMGGVPFIAPYAAAKAAVISISETLRVELAMTGSPIKVSVLCPGSTVSNVMESERARPAERGSERRTDDAEGMRLAIKSTFTGPDGLPAETVAARTLAAVRAGDFWVLSHPSERAVVEHRTAEILDAFPPATG